MDSLIGHLFKIAEIFLYIVPLLRKSFHRILTILHVASTLSSIYLFTRKCWMNFEKIDFSAAQRTVKVIQMMEKGTMAPLTSHEYGIFWCSYPSY